MSQAYKRKILIINPQFQYRMIGLFFVATILISLSILVFAWSNYHSFVDTLENKETEMSLYTDIVNTYLETDVTVFWVPKDLGSKMIWRLFLFTFLLGSGVLILGIFISHRIAGPLHNLNQKFKAISSGKEISKIKFRTKDEFQHLANSFNECMKYLSNQSKSVNETEVDSISDDSLLKELKSRLGRGNQSLVTPLKKALKEKRGKVNEEK